MAQQEMNTLREEMQRVEQDIEAKEQENWEDTMATEAPEFIALRKQEREWLVEKKKDMRQQLSALHAQLAGPAGEVLAATR